MSGSAGKRVLSKKILLDDGDDLNDEDYIPPTSWRSYSSSDECDSDISSDDTSEDYVDVTDSSSDENVDAVISVIKTTTFTDKIN